MAKPTKTTRGPGRKTSPVPTPTPVKPPAVPVATPTPAKVKGVPSIPNPAVDSPELLQLKAEATFGGETWEPLRGYEDKYQISTGGRIKSLNYAGSGQEGILRPYTTSDGFTVVNLWPRGADHPQATPLATLYRQISGPKRPGRTRQKADAVAAAAPQPHASDSTCSGCRCLVHYEDGSTSCTRSRNNELVCLNSPDRCLIDPIPESPEF